MSRIRNYQIVSVNVPIAERPQFWAVAHAFKKDVLRLVGRAPDGIYAYVVVEHIGGDNVYHRRAVRKAISILRGRGWIRLTEEGLLEPCVDLQS